MPPEKEPTAVTSALFTQFSILPMFNEAIVPV